MSRDIERELTKEISDFYRNRRAIGKNRPSQMTVALELRARNMKDGKQISRLAMKISQALFEEGLEADN